MHEVRMGSTMGILRPGLLRVRPGLYGGDRNAWSSRCGLSLLYVRALRGRIGQPDHGGRLAIE